jgi:hypothetical protein
MTPPAGERVEREESNVLLSPEVAVIGVAVSGDAEIPPGVPADEGA